MRPLYRAKTITIKLDNFKHFAETIQQYHAFKNFQNSLTTVKVMTKTKVAPFYLGHGVGSHSAALDKER